MTTLVLASGSPRRRELLGRFGVDFEVRPADVDEASLADEVPADLVARLAAAKAQAVSDAALEVDEVVLGADTVVVLDGEVLGKPSDASEARRMLGRLSARTHQVLTGVAVASRLAASHTADHATFDCDGTSTAGFDPAADLAPVPSTDSDGSSGLVATAEPSEVSLGPAVAVRVEVVATEVTFVNLSDADIDWYVATGEPLDKAGAYGIQGLGAVFVSSIRGSHDNVVGLPLAATRRLLADAGVELIGP